MFPPVKIVSGGLEIREYGPQDTDQVTDFLTTGDRSALPPGAPHDTGDVPDWLAQGVHRHRLSGGKGKSCSPGARANNPSFTFVYVRTTIPSARANSLSNPASSTPTSTTSARSLNHSRGFASDPSVTNTTGLLMHKIRRTHAPRGKYALFSRVAAIKSSPRRKPWGNSVSEPAP